MGRIAKIITGLGFCAGGTLASLSQARSAFPPDAPPTNLEVLHHVALGGDLVTTGAAVFALITAFFSGYQILNPGASKEDVDKAAQGISAQIDPLASNVNDLSGQVWAEGQAAEERNTVAREQEAENNAAVLRELEEAKRERAELSEQLKQVIDQVAQTNPSEAGPFAEATTKLVDSGDASDVERAREIVAGKSEQAADEIMADAEARDLKNAERYRQAARIYAITSPSKAKKAYEKAVALDPSDFSSWIELGQLRMQYDSLDSAEVAFKNGLQQVPDKHGRLAIHVAYSRLFVQRGNGMAALSELQQAADIGDELIAQNNASGAVRSNLSVVYDDLGDLEITFGNMGAARSRYEQGLAVTEMLADADPDNSKLQRNLSISYNKLGNVEMAAGDLAAARERFEADIAIAKHLAVKEPGNAQWQRDLSVSYNKLGEVEVAAGDLAAARERFEASLAIFERLTAQEPGNAGWQRDLSICYTKVGDVGVKAGDLTASRERFVAGLTIAKRLAAQEPGNAQWQRDLSVSYGKLGDVEVKAGDLAAARERFEAGLIITKRLAAQEPGNAEWQRDLSISYERLGDLALEAHPADTQTAQKHFRQTSDARWRIARSNPDFSQPWADLAVPLLRRLETAEMAEDAAAIGEVLPELMELAQHWQSREFQPDRRMDAVFAVLDQIAEAQDEADTSNEC